MASLQELYDLSNETPLRNRIAAAVVIVAEEIRNEASPTAPRIKWAADAFRNPEGSAQSMLWALLGNKNTASRSQIVGADDATILQAVRDEVDVFANNPRG